MGRPLSRLAMALVPQNHPWRWWFASHVDRTDAITRSTLRPRAPLGELGLVSIPSRPRGRHRYKAAVAWAVLYLAVADFVSVLPGLGLAPDPITPLHWAGLTDAPTHAPSLPELIGQAAGATLP